MWSVKWRIPLRVQRSKHCFTDFKCQMSHDESSVGLPPVHSQYSQWYAAMTAVLVPSLSQHYSLSSAAMNQPLVPVAHRDIICISCTCAWLHVCSTHKLAVSFHCCDSGQIVALATICMGRHIHTCICMGRHIHTCIVLSRGNALCNSPNKDNIFVCLYLGIR